MKISIKIEDLSLEEAATVADVLNCPRLKGTQVTAETTSAAPTPEPKKRKPKEEKAAPAPTPEPAEEDDLAEVPDNVEEDNKITADTLREDLVKFATKHGKEKAYAVLSTHGKGAKKVADVPENLYSAVYMALQKGLK